VAAGCCAAVSTGVAVADRHVTDERLSAFLDDELEEDTALRVTRHLAGCPRCIEELEELRDTRDALRRLPSLQAPVLTAEARPDRSTARHVSRTAMLTGAMTMAVVLLGGAVYVVGGDRGDVVPPMETFLVDHVARTGGGPVPPSVGDSAR
jgi:anti-sigma factor RsiW